MSSYFHFSNSLVFFPDSISQKPRRKKLFPNLSSSSNLRRYRPISSKPHFPRPFALMRNSLSNPLRKPATMFELVKVSSFKSGNDGDDAIQTLEQEPFVDGSTSNRIESTLNRRSKWVVLALFVGVILWRHDGESVWAMPGLVMNTILSVALKRIINQERPVTALNKSDPGMPSSHSQSIFFIITFSVLSIAEGLGINNLTLAIGGSGFAFGSYLSWLRVSQRLHTASQVVVGAIVGLIFAISWYWAWNAFVSQAFVSSLLVRVIVLLVAAGLSLGLVFHVYKNWLKYNGS